MRYIPSRGIRVPKEVVVQNVISRGKAAVVAVGVVVLTVILSGCLQSQTVVNVNGDGSGTVEETFLMQQQVLQMLAGMSEGSGFSLLDEAELESDASDYGEGVTLQSAEEVNTDWGGGYRAVYSFEDVNQVKINQNPSNDVPAQGAQMGPDQPRAEEYIRFEMDSGQPNTLDVILPEQGDAELESQNEAEGNGSAETGDVAQQEIESLAELYRDMRISVDVMVDGRIVDTDATHVEGNTVTLLDMDFNRIIERPEMLEELASREAGTITEVQQTVNDIPGIKVEVQPRVRVRFQ